MTQESSASSSFEFDVKYKQINQTNLYLYEIFIKNDPWKTFSLNDSSNLKGIALFNEVDAFIKNPSEDTFQDLLIKNNSDYYIYEPSELNLLQTNKINFNRFTDAITKITPEYISSILSSHEEVTNNFNIIKILDNKIIFSLDETCLWFSNSIHILRSDINRMKKINKQKDILYVTNGFTLNPLILANEELEKDIYELKFKVDDIKDYNDSFNILLHYIELFEEQKYQKKCNLSNDFIKKDTSLYNLLACTCLVMQINKHKLLNVNTKKIIAEYSGMYPYSETITKERKFLLSAITKVILENTLNHDNKKISSKRKI